MFSSVWNFLEFDWKKWTEQKMNEMIIDLPTSCHREYFEFLKCLEFLDVVLHCVVTDVFHKNGITWKENLLKFCKYLTELMM